MLPRFAATVCRTTVKQSLSFASAIESRVMANGTKVIRATSLVTNIEEKKQSKTENNED
jgi:hypothetical protein